MDKLEPIRRVFRNAGLYNHAADDLLCGELLRARIDAGPHYFDGVNPPVPVAPTAPAAAVAAPWPTEVLNRDETLRVLSEHNAWRRDAGGEQTDPRILGLALDAVIAHLSAPQSPPAAVAAANVTPMRQLRADLARLVESINATVYANGDGLSVTEAIGALELAKLELLKEQEQ